MTPTICTDEEERCPARRHSIHKVRKENTPSTFSVINYVGKRTKRLTVPTSRKKNDNTSFFGYNLSNSSISSCSSGSGSSSNSLSSSTNSLSSLHSSDAESDENLDSDDGSSGESSGGGDYNSSNERSSSNSSASSNISFSNTSYTSENEDIMDLERIYAPYPDEICDKLSSLMKVRYSLKFRDNSKLPNLFARPRRHTTSNHGLLEIAIRTVQLMHRNQQLQAKLAQLQTETQAFITSVMANPENRELRESIEKKSLT